MYRAMYDDGISEFSCGMYFVIVWSLVCNGPKNAVKPDVVILVEIILHSL